MKKLFLLIVSLFFLCVSCEQEKQEKHGTTHAQHAIHLYVSNTSTNNYLMYYTNSKWGRDDRSSYTRSGITHLTNGDYFQFFAHYLNNNWDIVSNEIDKIVTIKFYDPETTNFLFKITNKITLLKEEKPYRLPPTNKYGIPQHEYGLSIWLVISDSTFTNAYWGTTNE